ncbi:MAG: GAF domain-containing protein [Chloroflexota bacterium]
MSEQTVNLRDLATLISKLDAVASLEDAVAHVETFLASTLMLKRVDLTPTAVFPPAAPGETAVSLALSHAPLWLSIELKRPLSAEEVALLQTAVSLLATVPSQQKQLTPAQIQLYHQLNQAIQGRNHLQKMLETLQSGFSAAFPQVAGRLYTHQAETGALAVQALFGLSQQENDAQTLAELQAHPPNGTEPVVIRSQVTVPIRYGDKTQAFLVADFADNLVSQTDIWALELLGSQLGVVLANQKLLATARQRASQLETIYRVTEYARMLQPLPLTLKEIHQQLKLIFAAPTCYLALYEMDDQQVVFPCSTYQGEDVAIDPISIYDAGSLAVWVLTNNLPYATDDWPADAKPVPGLSPLGSSRSIMCVPMRVGDEVLGVLSIQSNVRNAFDASHFQTLTAVSDHVAIIIKNANLYTQTQNLVELGARDYLTAIALRDAMSAIGTSLEQEVVIKNYLQTLGDVIMYDTAYLFLYDNQRLNLAGSYDTLQRPLVLEADILESFWNNSPYTVELIQKKEPIILSRLNGAQERNWLPIPSQRHIRSWLALPLLVGDLVLGLLVVNRFEDKVFTRREERLSSTLTAHAAIAIQNALLHQEKEGQLAELSTLYQASATMTANLDQDIVVESVAEEMVQALQADSCFIFVDDGSKERLQLAAQAHYSSLSDQTERINVSGRVLLLSEQPVLAEMLKAKTAVTLRHDTARSSQQRTLLSQFGFQSILFVPLLLREKSMGFLLLGQTSEPRVFASHALRLAQNLANQAAVAIEQARLFSQAQRRVDELSAFHEIVLHLNTPLELRAVLDTITDSALKLTNADNVHIYMYDEITSQFSFGSALWRDGRRERATKKLRSKGITATVVQQASPVVINDARTHRLFQSKQAKRWGINAIAGFPLKHGREVVGAFTITYLSAHTFTDDELLLLNLLADQAAVAIKNAGLYAQTERRLLAMSALVDMAKQVTGNLKLDSVLETTVGVLKDLLDARASTITMLSDDGTNLIIAKAAGVKADFVGAARMKIGEGISGEVVRTGEPLYVDDTHSQPDFLFFDDVVRSLLVVPLKVRDEVIGTLTVDSDQPYSFDEADRQLMTVAAAQVSVAIANARLFEDLEHHAAELALAYNELKASDRLKDELVQNVSHELRTPLTFVKGYVDLLMEGEMGLISFEQQEALQIVSDKTDEITRIIGDIVTLQRIDPTNLEREHLSLAQLIRTTVASHQLIADDRGLQIVHELPPKLAGWVNADKDRINQVLNNLIGNAIKFSPDGGKIAVKMLDKGDIVCISVSDEGIGMPADQVERIFDRFYQVDGSSRRRFSGTGLGLAIVKRIVEAHEGVVWVDSELNVGSTFYFTLPHLREEPARR